MRGQRELKTIPVHRDHFVLEALVDDEDHEFLAQHRWIATVRKTTTYANTTIRTTAGFKCVSMHRMVIGDAEEDWDATLGGWPLEVNLDNGKTVYILPEKYSRLRKTTVNHVDGNGLNNTRPNLRHLSCADQAKNRRFR